MKNHGSKFLLLPVSSDVGRVLFKGFVFVNGHDYSLERSHQVLGLFLTKFYNLIEETGENLYNT